MNKRGAIGLSLILILAVGAIVALVLFQESANQVAKSNPSTTTTILNQTITFPAAGGKVILTGQELVASYGLTNKSSGAVVPTTNYTLQEEVRTSDGLKGIVITGKAGDWAGLPVNVSYVYYPDGYIDDAGGRSIAGIIVLLAALAVAIFVLAPFLKERFDL